MNRFTWEHNARTIPRDYKIHCLDCWPLLTFVSVLVLILNPLSSTMPLYDFASFEGHTGENLLSFFLQLCSPGCSDKSQVRLKYWSYCTKEVLLTYDIMWIHFCFICNIAKIMLSNLLSSIKAQSPGNDLITCPVITAPWNLSSPKENKVNNSRCIRFI